MSNRVLNFSEFNTKYSSGEGDSNNLDTISNAAANFEEGFDDTTYDLPEIGPKRPVSGNYEATPSSLGGGFNENPSQEMNAPYPEEEADEDEEGDFPGAMAEQENEEDDSDDEGDDEDYGNPEKEGQVKESYSLVKGFARFVNEYHTETDHSNMDTCKYCDGDGCEDCNWDGEISRKDPNYDQAPTFDADDYDDSPYSRRAKDIDYDKEYAGLRVGRPKDEDDEYGYNSSEDDDTEFCSDCGAVQEYGYNCGCNM